MKLYDLRRTATTQSNLDESLELPRLQCQLRRLKFNESNVGMGRTYKRQKAVTNVHLVRRRIM